MGERTSPSDGVAARQLAIKALLRIGDDGAYANLVLPPLLERSGLEERDRRLVTTLVYGTTRMQRACDYLVDRFVLDQVEPQVRAALRLGAYQLQYLDTPPHAAVSATVGAVKGRGKSVVNAVLRRVAADLLDRDGDWPDEATRLSYPDWIAASLTRDLGSDEARAAMEAMNEAASVHTRDDGYVQDPASQWVTDAVGARRGERVADLCAAPGGKATALVETGATVIAADLRPNRARLIARNARQLDVLLPTLVADGRRPPFRPGSFDRVLLDAPCSGLGSLRRRADARWNIDQDGPRRLAELQVELVSSALGLLRPGGTLVYSVCTLTADETIGVLDQIVHRVPSLDVLDLPSGPWSPWPRHEGPGPVGYLLPGEHDGMSIWRVRTPGGI